MKSRAENKLKIWFASALALAAASFSTVALSQTACDGNESDLPQPLITFCPGQVASAFDINHNFRTLRQDIAEGSDQKLDKDGTDALVINNGTDSDLSGGGSIIIGDPAGANVSFDSNEILSRNGTGSGHLYLNASGNDQATHIQTDGGQVFLGGGGDETRLTVNGNMTVQGSLKENCPSDTVRIGDSCIEATIRSVQTYNQAVNTCHDAGRRICTLGEYATCDIIAPSGSTCTAHTDDDTYTMWSSSLLAGTWQVAVWNGGSGNDSVSARSSSNSADFYCCESL